MTAYKRIGVKVKRTAEGWSVDERVYKGNKGQAVEQWLREHCVFKNGVWIKDVPQT